MIKEWTNLLVPLRMVPPANPLDSHDIVLEDFLTSRANRSNKEEDAADVQERLELGTRWI
jgi:hypothetical protein